MTKLLIDIPEVPQGSKTCAKLCLQSYGQCMGFTRPGEKVGLHPNLKWGDKEKWWLRCPQCLAAESAALDLLRGKEEKG